MNGKENPLIVNAAGLTLSVPLMIVVRLHCTEGDTDREREGSQGNHYNSSIVWKRRSGGVFAIYMDDDRALPSATSHQPDPSVLDPQQQQQRGLQDQPGKYQMGAKQ